MKYYSVLIVPLVGTLLLSGFFGSDSINQAEGHLCFFEPSAGDPFVMDIRCESGHERMLISELNQCTYCSGYNHQPSSPVINLMINPGELNTTQTLKLTNLGNGTTLVNVVNATN
jgi:hypothetical protein